MVVTFFPHPDKVLDDVNQRYYLTTPEGRAALLLHLGVDFVITQPFDDETRKMSAVNFVDLLVEQLRIKELWVGADFALGFQREGDTNFLRTQGRERGFTVTAIELITTDVSDQLIRSTKIRQLLRCGAMNEAEAMLGRAYALTGVVARGEQRGRAIGVPTANLDVWAEQIIPANGVYATWARLGDETFMAATNIGNRPTFAGDGLTIEAHLLDFERDIYGERLELRFEKHLRAERNFAGFQDLVAQIKRDIAAARLYFENNPLS